MHRSKLHFFFIVLLAIYFTQNDLVKSTKRKRSLKERQRTLIAASNDIFNFIWQASNDNTVPKNLISTVYCHKSFEFFTFCMCFYVSKIENKETRPNNLPNNTLQNNFLTNIFLCDQSNS